MRVSSGTHMTMSVEAPKTATLCGINCPVAVFGPAKPLFLWRGGAEAPPGARPPPCDSIRRLVQYIRVATLPLHHVDN